MSSRKKRKKLKVTRNQKLIFSGLVLLILILVIALVIVLVDNFLLEDFKVESRIQNLKEEKKDDIPGFKHIGWIRVQGTNIDYPVVHAPDFDFSYITEDFTWTEVDFKKLNNITYVSGHNFLNLSSNPEITDKSHRRFEQLMSFNYLDFVKDNQFIQYTVNGKEYVFKVYSVSYIEHSEIDYYNEDKYSKSEVKDYVEETLENSIFDFDIDVNEDDMIISLDTCTRMYGDNTYMQFRVNGRLLRDGEKMKLSKVKKSSKYKEIEKLMKGGVSYEEA